MKEVVIKNQELLDTLNRAMWFYDNRDQLDGVKHQCWDHEGGIDKWCGDDHLKEILDEGSRHEGYPDSVKGWNLNEHLRGWQDNYQGSWHSYLPVEWHEQWSRITQDLQTILCVAGSAVANIYPPGGYISWHNNANARGLNLIFSWSETGDSEFDYLEDDGRGKKVVLKDRAGEWVCRYGVFGGYEDDYPLVYHTAKTNCWRMTFAYLFGLGEAKKEMQDFIIDAISNP